MRTRAERRHNDVSKARRKRRLAKELYSSNNSNWEWFDNLHQYSKNKIHCSCPLCASKSNRKRKGWYGPAYDPPIADKRRLEKLNYDLEEGY